MPYNSDKIIYVDTTASPQEGISIGDIQAVLSSSANDIGQLIRNGSINKWAKYKPVKKAGLDFPTERNSDFTWKTAADTGGPATWWKAYNGQCGLTFATYTSMGTSNMSSSSSFFHELLAGNLGWGYEGPTGGINQYPYRFFDFLYYSHYAPKPVTGVYDNLRLDPDNGLTVQLTTSRAQNDLGIQPADLVINNSSLKDWYIGVLIWRSNTVGEYTFAISEDTIDDGATEVKFSNMSAFGGRTAKIVPFLASIHTAQGADPGGGVYLSCDVEPQDVTIRGLVNPIETDVDAIWVDSFHVRVQYSVNIINNTGHQLTISTLRVALYEDNVEVYPKTYSNIVIPVDGTWDDTSVLLFQYSYDSSKEYTVRVTSLSPSIDVSTDVNTPRN